MITETPANDPGSCEDPRAAWLGDLRQHKGRRVPPDLALFHREAGSGQEFIELRDRVCTAVLWPAPAPAEAAPRPGDLIVTRPPGPPAAEWGRPILLVVLHRRTLDSDRLLLSVRRAALELYGS